MTDFSPTGIITLSGEPTPGGYVGLGYTMAPGLDYSALMKVAGYTVTTLVNFSKPRPTIGLAWPRTA